MAAYGLIPALDYAVFESVRTIARILAGSFLIAIAFYLQVVAEGSQDPEGEPVSWKFRLLPSILGFFILHRAGSVHLYPYSRISADILFNLSLLWLIVEGFFMLLRYYGLDPPRKRIPEFIREGLPFVTCCKGNTDDVEPADEGGEPP